MKRTENKNKFDELEKLRSGHGIHEASQWLQCHLWWDELVDEVSIDPLWWDELVDEVSISPLSATLKQHSNGPSYSNTVIGTLAVDGWAVTFGTARRGLGRAAAHPGPSSLYQMQQPTHQWQV